MSEHNALPEVRHAPPSTTVSGGSAFTRRQFLKRAVMAGGAVAVPCFVPASALGLNGAVPPSERIILGGMGVGNRGSDDLRWMLPERDVQFVAICDAKKASREAVKRIVDNKYGNQDCAMYRDMREFLAKRTDIDEIGRASATGRDKI